MTTPVVEVRGVDRRYKGAATKALDGVTFDVRSGENFGLLGPNGAGKTTMIKLICGVSRPTRGSVSVWGEDPQANPLRVKQRIGVVHQSPAFEMMLSVRDNLDIAAALRNGGRRHARSLAPKLLEEFGLGPHGGDLIFTLSGGMQKRLAVVRALMSDPSLLVLDEPSAGLDVEGRWRIWQVIHDARVSRGMTVIWTSHDLDEIERNCERIAILKEGQLLTTAEPAELIRANGVEVAVIDIKSASDADRLQSLLAGTHLVGSRVGATFEVSGKNVKMELPRLLMAAADNEVDIAGVRFRSRSLEDAFIDIVRGTSAKEVEQC